MISPNNGKKYSNFKVTIQLAMRLHNPQVVQAYRHHLDSPDEAINGILGKYLKIYPDDSILEIILKIALFYLVDARLWVQASTPMWYAQKAASFKPQLAIQFRPQGVRKRFGFNSYAGNPELHIPHYNGDNAIQIPAYTIGKFSAKYTLTDQTYLMVNAHTQEEAIEVVAKLASYTKPAKRPAGDITENITTNTRKKKPRMDGIKIEAYKAEYLTGGKDGIKTLVKIQL
jgi:hypothetical protein